MGMIAQRVALVALVANGLVITPIFGKKGLVVGTMGVRVGIVVCAIIASNGDLRLVAEVAQDGGWIRIISSNLVNIFQ